MTPVQLTPVFLLGMTVCVAAFWTAPEERRTHVLALVGLAFLAALDPVSAGVVAVLTLLVGMILHTAAAWVVVAVFCVGRLLALPEYGSWVTPLGFGFTCCRLAHYVVERGRGTLPEHRTIDLWAYAFFFPIVAIGPIQRFGAFLRERDRHRWDPEMFAEGLERLLVGYAKVVVGANTLVGTWLRGQVLVHVGIHDTPAVIFAECVVQGAGMYLSFSGLSDIAIGLGRLVGQRLPENFDFPFLKPNIARFWECWHATLSSWCRDYVYLPVAGATRMRTVGLVTSMIVLGLWHEFTLTFIVWGVWHGVGLSIFRLWRQHVTPHLPAADTRWKRALAQGAGTAATLLFVLVSLVWTKGENLEDGWLEFTILLGMAS